MGKGGGGNRAWGEEEGKGGTERGEVRGGRDGLGLVGLQIFLTRPVDRSTGLKAGPDSGLRPNFYNGLARWRPL